jgi:lipoyl(octanoyl) transferase
VVTNHVRIRRLARQPYAATWAAMRTFIDAREPATPDEIWCLEHPPVFTLGRAAAREHIHDPGAVPVIPIDRGGEVTYHGPGQPVVYPLIDLRRLGLGVRGFVELLEAVVIELLAQYGVAATTRAGAPGVYIGERKVAALGLRVRRGCCFHGLALNVDCDLAPFARINPCGYRGLAVTRTRDEGVDASATTLAEGLVELLTERLGYTRITAAPGGLEAL